MQAPAWGIRGGEREEGAVAAQSAFSRRKEHAWAVTLQKEAIEHLQNILRKKKTNKTHNFVSFRHVLLFIYGEPDSFFAFFK